MRSLVKGWCTPNIVQLFAAEGTQTRTHFLLVREGCPSSVCIALWPFWAVWILKVLLHGHSTPLPWVCGERCHTRGDVMEERLILWRPDRESHCMSLRKLLALSVSLSQYLKGRGPRLPWRDTVNSNECYLGSISVCLAQEIPQKCWSLEGG